MRKMDCVRHAMNSAGYGDQALPNVPGLRDEESTGSPARDLQTAFDWGCRDELDKWDMVYRAIKHWEDHRIELTAHLCPPTSYHTMCLFRVVAYTHTYTDKDVASAAGLTEDKPCKQPEHYIGIKRGDDWMVRDANGVMNAFPYPPVVDAWAYID